MKAKVLTLIVLSSLAVSCAKENAASNTSTSQYLQSTDTTVPYQTTDTTQPGYVNTSIWGSSADFNIVSPGTLQDYAGHPIYNPSNFKIEVNLTPYTNSYGGTVTISYYDNGVTYQEQFTSGHSADETKYNRFVTVGGTKVWHGFFEDYLGAIVIVIDKSVGLGDGDTSDTTASGSIWFKNFGATYAPHPPTWCWFVSLGPYDCRAWPEGRGVNTSESIYPNNGYQKLGSFSGLNLQKAFNSSTVSL